MLEKEVRQEERERTTDKNVPDSMKQDITLAELKKAIKQLSKNKYQGTDSISNEMILYLGNTALQRLLDIFNLSWKEGQVPQCWKKARMIPGLKKEKNKIKVLNYRPISLTSCVCKTMARIVSQRLQWYLDSESTIAPEQAGFRRYDH